MMYRLPRGRALTAVQAVEDTVVATTRHTNSSPHVTKLQSPWPTATAILFPQRSTTKLQKKRSQIKQTLTVRVHPGSEGVKDPSDAHGDVVLPVKVEAQSLGHALTFVVARSHA